MHLERLLNTSQLLDCKVQESIDHEPYIMQLCHFLSSDRINYNGIMAKIAKFNACQIMFSCYM